MLALGVDTSNYATSLAVVDAASREVVCALKRFLPVKPGELGLRQSDAVFHHTAALPEMARELAAQCDLTAVGAVGVSQTPRPEAGSYMPCFLAGASFAAAFAAARGLCPVTTSHQQGHLAAALYGAGQPGLAQGDLLFFHASGGTTELLLTHGYQIKALLGKSRDLYAGQAVDRLGVRLGFGFPAGEQVSRLALQCEEEVAPKVSVQGTDCHLSGLQNQCQRLLDEGKSTEYVCKYCLVAIADTVLAMVRAARQARGALPVLLAGGVMSSETIRARFAREKDVYFAPAALSSDNAVGVALIAAKEAGCG